MTCARRTLVRSPLPWKASALGVLLAFAAPAASKTQVLAQDLSRPFVLQPQGSGLSGGGTNTGLACAPAPVMGAGLIAIPVDEETQGQTDLNGDGILDNGDIQTFLALFLGGDLGADLNGDGILDNGDIQTFLTLFLGGC